MKTLYIVAANGVPFVARLVEYGDRYGLDDCLTHSAEGRFGLRDGGPMVEFYDARYMHTPRGQFVSRYYVSTLLDGCAHGLLLDGGNPDDWSIDVDTMLLVRLWLANVTTPGARSLSQIWGSES